MQVKACANFHFKIYIVEYNKNCYDMANNSTKMSIKIWTVFDQIILLYI